MLYWLGKTLFHIYFRLFHRIEVSGLDRLPPRPFILASNHSSLLDPPLVGSSLPFNIYYMAKEELFKIPVFGSVIRKVHAFPIKRGATDVSAIRNALNVLENKNALLMFPEGTRKKKGRALKGISFVAHKSGLPVLCVRIIGNDSIRMFSKLRLVIGPVKMFPETPEEKAEAGTYQTFAEEIVKTIYSIEIEPCNGLLR